MSFQAKNSDPGALIIVLIVFFKKWANPAIFLFFSNTNYTEKNCRLQRDSKSDRRNRRRACWPLDHGPIVLIVAAIKSVRKRPRSSWNRIRLQVRIRRSRTSSSTSGHLRKSEYWTCHFEITPIKDWSNCYFPSNALVVDWLVELRIVIEHSVGRNLISWIRG